MTILQQGIEQALKRILKPPLEEQITGVPVPEQLARRETLLPKTPPEVPPEEIPPEEGINLEDVLARFRARVQGVEEPVGIPMPPVTPIEVPVTEKALPTMPPEGIKIEATTETGMTTDLTLKPDYSVWRGTERVGDYDPATDTYTPIKPPPEPTEVPWWKDIWRELPINPYYWLSAKEKKAFREKEILLNWAKQHDIKDPEEFVEKLLAPAPKDREVVMGAYEPTEEELRLPHIPYMPEYEAESPGERFVGDWVAPMMAFAGAPTAAAIRAALAEVVARGGIKAVVPKLIMGALKPAELLEKAPGALWGKLKPKPKVPEIKPPIPEGVTPVTPEVTPILPVEVLKPATPPPTGTKWVFNLKQFRFEPQSIRPSVSSKIDSVARHISFSGEEIPSPKLGVGAFFKRFFTKAFDEQYPVRDFVNQAKKLGIDVNIEEDPYIALNLMKGFYGKANSFLTRGTSGRVFWKVVGGKTVKTEWGKSFESIVKPLAEKELDREFSTYLIARASIGRQLAERGIKVPFKIADARKVIKELVGKHPEFKNAAKELYEYQDTLLKYAYESGLLSRKTLTQFRRLNKDYVPYFRVLEDLMGKGEMGKNIARTKAVFKRIKGSEKPIVDPLESIVRNTYAILHASDSNQVGIMMANLAEKNPVLKSLFTKIKTPIRPVAQVTPKELGLEGLTQAQLDNITTIFRPSFFNTENNIASIMIKGKRVSYKVDPDLYKAVASMNQGDIGILMKILGYPAKLLRAGAVLSPDFSLAKNPTRDTMTAFVYSRFGFIPGYDTIRGLFSWLGKTESYQLAERAGILKSMLVSVDRQYAGKTLGEILKSKPPIKYIKHPIETLQIMSELTEMASRMGEARLALAKGKSPIQAAFAGRDITLDFGIMGSEVRQRGLNQIIAFFNANMRAAEKLGRETIQHPGTVLPKAVAGITVPSVLLYLYNRNDPRWKEIPQWQKDLFWIIFTEKNIWRIPKPFELGLIFGSIPERILEYIDNQDSKAMNELWANILEMGTPGFIPTALQPIIENMTNYSFFLDRKVVPEGRENMPAELQYSLYTPEIVKKFGEWVNYSPAKIDNILKGYTAGLGRYAIEGLDSILKNTGILPDIPEPSPTLVDRPIVKALIIRDPYGSSGQTIIDFYDVLGKTEGDEKLLKEMLRLNKEKKYNDYLKQHPETMFRFDWDTGDTYSASARYLRRVASDLSEIRRKQYEIYEDPDMSPEDKKIKIDEMNRLLTEVAGLALSNLKQMPLELRLDLLPETAEEPEAAKALIYEISELAPSYLREYIYAHQEEFLMEDLKSLEFTLRDMKETDQKLLEKYDKEMKGQSDSFREQYRRDNPDIDAALNLWGRVSSIKSQDALDLLKQKAEKLGIPYESILALKKGGIQKAEMQEQPATEPSYELPPEQKEASTKRFQDILKGIK